MLLMKPGGSIMLSSNQLAGTVLLELWPAGAVELLKSAGRRNSIVVKMESTSCPALDTATKSVPSWSRRTWYSPESVMAMATAFVDLKMTHKISWGKEVLRDTVF